MRQLHGYIRVTILEHIIEPKHRKLLMGKSTVTGRINAKTFELLEEHPEGLHWSELLSKIEASDSSFHPKTVNGCVWKLVERFPDKVYKPSKGLFRLLKYKSKSKK